MARILVVDDENLIRTTVCEMLEIAGYEVSEASNGKMAIAQQQKQPFDLIITDIIMPEKDGIETIIELKAIDPNIQIIGMSGGGRSRNTDFLEIAKKFGAARVLYKPFTENQLLEAVAALL